MSLAQSTTGAVRDGHRGDRPAEAVSPSSASSSGSACAQYPGGHRTPNLPQNSSRRTAPMIRRALPRHRRGSYPAGRRPARRMFRGRCQSSANAHSTCDRVSAHPSAWLAAIHGRCCRRLQRWPLALRKRPGLDGPELPVPPPRRTPRRQPELGRSRFGRIVLGRTTVESSTSSMSGSATAPMVFSAVSATSTSSAADSPASDSLVSAPSASDSASAPSTASLTADGSSTADPSNPTLRPPSLRV